MRTKTLAGTRPLWLTVLATLVLAFTLMLAGRPTLAFAEEGDTASISTSEVLIPMGNDVLWFGESMEQSGRTVANDLLGAGRNLSLTGITTGGSIRVAGQNLSLRDCTVAENITVAGQDVLIENCKASSIAAAGQTVTVSGSCKDLTIYAAKVYIDGTVEGDVEIGADTVEVGTNARIKGTMNVSASSDPVMQRGAEVADVNFTQVEGSSSDSFMGQVSESDIAGLVSVLFWIRTIASILGTLVVAVLAEWLFSRHTAGAAAMIRTRTAATICSGIVGTLAAPIALILMLVLVVTLPVAGALFLTLLAIAAVAGGFLGASVFKLCFPRLGRFVCALVGGAIVGVASIVPYLGTLVSVAAFVYLFGYVLQCIYLGMRNKGDVGATEAAPALDAPVPPEM